MEREVFVSVDLHGAPVFVGRLWCRNRGGRQSATFEYDPGWLEHPERFAIDPALTLTTGPFHTAGSETPSWRVLPGLRPQPDAGGCPASHPLHLDRFRGSRRVARSGPGDGQFIRPRYGDRARDHRRGRRRGRRMEGYRAAPRVDPPGHRPSRFGVRARGSGRRTCDAAVNMDVLGLDPAPAMLALDLCAVAIVGWAGELIDARK